MLSDPKRVLAQSAPRRDRWKKPVSRGAGARSPSSLGTLVTTLGQQCKIRDIGRRSRGARRSGPRRCRGVQSSGGSLGHRGPGAGNRGDDRPHCAVVALGPFFSAAVVSSFIYPPTTVHGPSRGNRMGRNFFNPRPLILVRFSKKRPAGARTTTPKCPHFGRAPGPPQATGR